MELHEQHQLAIEICAELVPVLSCEKLDFVAYNMGVKRSEFYPTTLQESGEALEVIDWNEKKAA